MSNLAANAPTITFATVMRSAMSNTAALLGGGTPNKIVTRLEDLDDRTRKDIGLAKSDSYKRDAMRVRDDLMRRTLW